MVGFISADTHCTELCSKELPTL